MRRMTRATALAPDLVALPADTARGRSSASPTTRPASRLPIVVLFLGVLGAELWFGLWMSAQGFRWLDGISRAVNSLVVLHGSDPHLAAIGFVWMPLPSAVELLWVLPHPIWPEVVASGFASSMTSALGAATAAVVLLITARRLGLPDRLGLPFALVVAANPMLFLYGANGLSEGAAAPFLIGAVCALTLFWHSGRRRYVAFSGLALALSFSAVYEAVAFGLALAAALVAGLLLGGDEDRPPRERGRAAWALGLVLVLPATYIGLLWVAANGIIMGDPLYFATGEHSNKALTEEESGIAFDVAGQGLDVLVFVGARTAPFLVPVAALLVVRALEGRFWSSQTLSLCLLALSVPFGLIAPLLFMGASFGWLRFFMYPLLVAAGWGLYEVAVSRRRERAAAVVLAGWVLAGPAALGAMADPVLGQEEHLIVRGVLTGKSGVEVGYAGDPISLTRPLAAYLEQGPLRRREWVALDQTGGFPIAGQVRGEHLDRLLLTPDRVFRRAVAAPAAHGVRYLLVPNPALKPRDAIVQAHPKLWPGRDPRFRLVRSWPERDLEWKLYEARGRVAAPTTLARARSSVER